MFFDRCGLFVIIHYPFDESIIHFMFVFVVALLSVLFLHFRLQNIYLLSSTSSSVSRFLKPKTMQKKKRLTLLSILIDFPFFKIILSCFIFLLSSSSLSLFIALRFFVFQMISLGLLYFSALLLINTQLS